MGDHQVRTHSLSKVRENPIRHSALNERVLWLSQLVIAPSEGPNLKQDYFKICVSVALKRYFSQLSLRRVPFEPSPSIRLTEVFALERVKEDYWRTAAKTLTVLF